MMQNILAVMAIIADILTILSVWGINDKIDKNLNKREVNNYV